MIHLEHYTGYLGEVRDKEKRGKWTSLCIFVLFYLFKICKLKILNKLKNEIKIEKNETFSLKIAWKHLSRGRIYNNGLFNFVKCRGK